MDFQLKKYKKEYDYSYTLGASATIELIRVFPERIYKVFISSVYNPKDEASDIRKICGQYGIIAEQNDKIISRLAPNDNVFVLAVFYKYEDELLSERSHVVLVNPSDMGNIGTIMRSAAGFGYEDLAIITPAADYFDPKTLRASMGAAFCVRTKCYASFGKYAGKFPDRQIFCFMLDGSRNIEELSAAEPPFSLVFGNESTGLPNEFKDIGTGVYIPHTNKIDSLNLSVAAGIGLYLMKKKIFAKNG